MPTADTAIITTLKAFDTNYEKDCRSFRPKSQGDEVEKSIQNRFLDSAFGSARNDREGVRKMNESNSQDEKLKDGRRHDPELLKKGLRCDLDQYEMLKRCSEKKDITEWNEWREKHPKEDILLEGADLLRFYLKAVLFNTSVDSGFSGGIHLESANLSFAQAEGGDFQSAHLENSDFVETHLEGANLSWAHLERANLFNSHLGGAELCGVHLEGAQLQGADLGGAILTNAHLEGADLYRAHLGRAKLQIAIVNGLTLLLECAVDRYTDVRNVGLGSARIDPLTKQLLEYNVRRLNWEDWYPKQHRLLAWLVRKFWQISDYGISTKRIIFTFFGLAFLFAIAYYVWGCIDYHLICNKDYPGIVSNLFVLEDSKQAVPGWLVPLRAVYFSIVTMTTLGLGDMYASAHSLFRGIFGHILLALQVTLGYVLLGALVTGFAVLFTAGGPAGKFANEKEDEKK